MRKCDIPTNKLVGDDSGAKKGAVVFIFRFPFQREKAPSCRCVELQKRDRRGHHFSAAAKTTTSPSSSLSFATLEYEVFVCLVT